MSDFEHGILTKQRKLVNSSEDYRELKANEWMKFFYGEEPSAKFALVTDINGTKYAINATDTFELSGDIDKKHTEVVGTANAAYSGAVTSIALNLATAPAKDIGTLVLKNDDGERERIDYTAKTGSGPYTFTVSKTLSYEYASGDYGAVEDPLMFYSDTVTVDTVNSIITFTGIDCFRDAFIEKIEAASGDPVEIWIEIKRYIVGEDNPRILMQNKAYATGPVRDMEGEGNSSTSVLASLDARYAKQTDLNRRGAVKEIAVCTAAPPTEVSGDRYIIDATTGTVHADWDGAAKNSIVEFDGSAWIPVTPEIGWTIYIEDEEKDALFDNSVWTLRSSSGGGSVDDSTSMMFGFMCK